MAKFDYKARNAQGELTEGQLDAQDANLAAQMLINRNLTPIDITAGNGQSTNRTRQVHLLTPRVKLDDLVIFCRQMYSLTKSGIPILRAVNGLAESTHSVRMSLALQDVAEQLERGRNLSSALHQHPQIFNQLFVSIVHVGENIGRLDDAFAQLSEYLQREQETRKQIAAATRYPMFVIIFITLALVVVNLKVIPTFASMFSKFGAELPIMTRVLIGMSNTFVNYWPHMLVGLIASCYVWHRYLQTDKGRFNWDKRKLGMPIVGSIIKRSLLGRFARSFALMLQSGVPLTNALNLVAEAVDNRFMGERIINMRRNIEKGESLSRVAHGSGLFTPLVMQMINVGEETGRIDDLLKEVAEYYEREVDYDLKSLTAKIEPILIVIVSSMVMILALGIFTPMWNMMGAATGG